MGWERYWLIESGGISTQNHGSTAAIAPEKPALQPIQGLIAEIPFNGTDALSTLRCNTKE